MSSRRILVAMLILVCTGSSVDPSHTSRSSLLVTAARAIGAKNPNPLFRNPDYLAARFLGPRERSLLRDGATPFVNALDQDFYAALDGLPSADLILGVTLRTKLIDSVLEQSLKDGVGQIVILGAGFDSRGSRFQGRLKGVLLFEVDHPPTQAHKKRRVIEVFGALPGHIRYVPMDFTRDDLLTELRKRGYSEKITTLFIWEGVTMYLPRSAVIATLHFVREYSAVGSVIVFDYYLSSYPGINNRETLVSKWSEPVIFGFPGISATESVRQAGLTVDFDHKRSDIANLYLRQPAGSSPLATRSLAAQPSGICLARVSRKP